MFITLKIWAVIFTEFCIWSTPGNRLCILKQERHRRRLAKAKEEKYLELQKAPLIRWKDFVLFYRGKRLMKNFITYLFLLFFLSGCGYTQLEMLEFDLINDRGRVSLETSPTEIVPTVGRFNKDIIIHYPNYNTHFVQHYSYWPYYPRYERRRNYRHHNYLYSQSHIYPLRVRSYFRQRERVVREVIRVPKEVIKEPVVTKPADDKVKREVWRRRNNPRGAKRLPPLTKKEE